MELISKSENVEHPLEEFFNIEAGTTEVTTFEPVVEPPVVPDTYDEKDTAVDAKFNEIYQLALANATALGDEVAKVEGKYKRGLAENITQLLSVALNAATQEGNYKQNTEKLRVSSKKAEQPNNVTNNVIVADRNTIMRMRREQQESGTTIDGEQS